MANVVITPVTPPAAAANGGLQVTANNGTAWATIPDVAVGSVLTSGGVGQNPVWSAAAAIGSATYAIPSSGNATFISALVTDHGAVGNFNWCVGYASNSGDAARGDHVLTIGYNTTPGGGRAITSDAAFEWRIEDYYNPGTGPYVEAHWQYYDATGAGFRPIACQINRTNGGYLTDATVNITSSGFSYLAMNAVQYFKFSQQQLQVFNSALFTIETNNYFWLKQKNAAGNGYVNLPYVTASDQISLGFGNDIKWGMALVALGGGSAPTLGTIGGTGPASAAQNSWMRAIDTTGAAFWVPVWK